MGTCMEYLIKPSLYYSTSMCERDTESSYESLFHYLVAYVLLICFFLHETGPDCFKQGFLQLITV